MTSARPRRPPDGTPVGGRSLPTRSGPLPLDRVAIVGIVNATPDSFSDGGPCLDPGYAADSAARMVAAGAGALDVGAESTRPGSPRIDAAEERRRLLPVLRAVRAAVPVPLSVDTMKAEVAAAALDAGADVVNDVSAGRFDRGMLPLCAREGVPIVLMHMHGTPATMHRPARYRDLLAEVCAFLRCRAAAARRAGIPAGAIVVDPGIGFGKTTAHNLAVLRHVDAVAALGYPVMVGVSRKRFLGELLGGAPTDARLLGTAAAVALAVAGGASLLRVHDVAAMRQVATVAAAIAGADA